uniref:Protein kinase domain-containing protein n=1 Tax=Bursaphelenchus xylophilus TaxID=6326 RepID=A0A1I7RLT9_BURXY
MAPIIDRFKSFFRGGSQPSTVKRPLTHVIKYDVDPSAEWQVIGELGDGAFGMVQKVVKINDPGRFAAAKCITLEDGEELEDLVIEIAILSAYPHQNVVGLIDAYFMDNKISMMLEFCAGGAVDDIMLELGKPLTESQICYITHYVVIALEYLHANLVIHRDLKAGNILLTSDGTIKLADFGVSAMMKEKQDKRNSFIGTPYWMAPEVMVCETFKDKPYDCIADVWSLGITCIEMAQMDPPNYQVSAMRVVIKIQKSDPPKFDDPKKWSAFLNDFVACCLVKNPNERPSARDLKTHPFIKDTPDRRPIMALLSEKNADIVDEEVLMEETASVDESGSVKTVDFESDVESHKISPNNSGDFSNPQKRLADKISPEATPVASEAQKVAKKRFAAPKPPEHGEDGTPLARDQPDRVFNGVKVEKKEIRNNGDVPNATLTETPTRPALSKSATRYEEPLTELQITGEDSPRHKRNISPGKQAIEILDDLYNALDNDEENQVQESTEIFTEEENPSNGRSEPKSNRNSHLIHAYGHEYEPETSQENSFIASNGRPTSKIGQIARENQPVNLMVNQEDEVSFTRSNRSSAPTLDHQRVPDVKHPPHMAATHSQSFDDQKPRPTYHRLEEGLKPSDSLPNTFNASLERKAKLPMNHKLGQMMERIERVEPTVRSREPSGDSSRRRFEEPRHQKMGSASTSNSSPPPPEPPIDYDDPRANRSNRQQAERGSIVSGASSTTSPRLSKHIGDVYQEPISSISAIDNDPRLRRPTDPTQSTSADEKENRPVERVDGKIQVEGIQPQIKSMLHRQQPNRATVTRKTRTYMVDGVQVTSTTLHVLGAQQDYAMRKKELQELKRLQRQEARDRQLLNERNEQERETQDRKFADLRYNVIKSYDAEMEQLCKLQKKKMEELERLQEEEKKQVAKNIKQVHEKEYRDFQVHQREEMKRLKYETDLLPKSQRKDALRHRKDQLEHIQAERENSFFAQRRRAAEKIMENLQRQHQEALARLDRQFLKDKHDLQRTVESTLWEQERQQMKERFGLRRQQLKGNFNNQRYLMQQRHALEQEHIQKAHQASEELLVRSLTAARKHMPKTLRNESKTRVQMFRESLRINYPNESSNQWHDRIREFEENEKRSIRQKLDEYDLKCKRRLEELKENNEMAQRELEQIQTEKSEMILKSEEQKVAEYEEEYQQLLADWEQQLPFRKRVRSPPKSLPQSPLSERSSFHFSQHSSPSLSRSSQHLGSHRQMTAEEPLSSRLNPNYTLALSLRHRLRRLGDRFEEEATSHTSSPRTSANTSFAEMENPDATTSRSEKSPIGRQQSEKLRKSAGVTRNASDMERREGLKTFMSPNMGERKLVLPEHSKWDKLARKGSGPLEWNPRFGLSQRSEPGRALDRQASTRSDRSEGRIRNNRSFGLDRISEDRLDFEGDQVEKKVHPRSAKYNISWKTGVEIDEKECNQSRGLRSPSLRCKHELETDSPGSNPLDQFSTPRRIGRRKTEEIGQYFEREGEKKAPLRRNGQSMTLPRHHFDSTMEESILEEHNLSLRSLRSLNSSFVQWIRKKFSNSDN